MDTENTRKREIRFELRLNDRERAAIRQQAEQRGLTESAFIRMSALGQPLPTRKTEIEVEAVAALNRVGSNLNQITRVANESKSLNADSIKSLSSLYKSIKSISAQIEGKIQ